MQDQGAQAGIVFFCLQENIKSDAECLQGTASPNKTQTFQATERTLDLHFRGIQLREIFGLLWFTNNDNTSHSFCTAEMEKKKSMQPLPSVQSLLFLILEGNSVVLPFPDLLLSQAIHSICDTRNYFTWSQVNSPRVQLLLLLQGRETLMRKDLSSKRLF